MVVGSGLRSSRQSAVPGNGRNRNVVVVRSSARVKDGGRVRRHVGHPAVSAEISGGAGGGCGRRFCSGFVEDPADVIVQDALVGLGVERIALGSAAENGQLKKKYSKINF